MNRAPMEEATRTAVLETPAWREVESEVDWPGRWTGLAIVASFLLIGVIGLLTIGQTAPDATTRWIARVVMGGFALLGGACLPTTLGRIIWPVRVRHAAPDVLPNVPTEPVTLEGSVVHGRVKYELMEDSEGWQFRPALGQWRVDKRLMLGFGIPFLTAFAGVLSWILHNQLNLGGWPIAIVSGVLATVACGGSVALLIGMMMRAGYRRLCCLSIPRNGGDLELDSPEEPNPEKDDGVRWIFLGETGRRRLTIPREQLGAVQLCPWKFVTKSQVTWAAQGLLVISRMGDGEHTRLPILLTSDFVSAARLMQRLAATLHVPYVFCADAEGCEAERIRAKTRRPLRIGGSLS
jgi:hypothetical protein